MSVPTDVDRTLLISAEGYEQRCRELDVLRKDVRRELSERLREARQDGDLADNPALQELLEEQALLERRIAHRELGPVPRARAEVSVSSDRELTLTCTSRTLADGQQARRSRDAVGGREHRYRPSR